MAENQSAVLYFESHITVDPVKEDQVEHFSLLCARRGFRVAKLLMEKDQPSTLDSFCTGRGREYTDIYVRTATLIKDLQQAGIHVRRYKIEDTVLDSKIKDTMELLL